MFACAPIVPQCTGSVFNIWYHLAVIGPLLDTEHLKARFSLTVLVYPISIGFWIWLVASLAPALRLMMA